MKTKKFPDESCSSDAEEQNSSRLENLHWCKCSHCTVMPTLIESKCCREYVELLGDKLYGIKCITRAQRFRHHNSP